MSERKNAIVIVVDGLQAGMLGCYGNTWIKTPEIDRLAAESFVFDRAIVDGQGAGTSFDAYWSGKHVVSFLSTWEPGKSPPLHTELFGILAAAGIRNEVITDDEDAFKWASHDPHFNAVLIPTPKKIRRANVWEASRMAALFAFAAERISGGNEPFCLWIHASGMMGPWDAPYELRSQYADVEDPVPPDLIEPPNLELAVNFDPDEMLGIQQAYAGQVSLLDTCCGLFLDAFRESPLAENTFLAFLGPFGYGLGEHRVVGTELAQTYSEMTHVPWLIRLPNGESKASRTNALIQPPDLFPTVVEWFCGPSQPPQWGGRSLWPLIHGSAERIRDRAASLIGHEWSLRTEKWHLRSSGADKEKAESQKFELYVKPDDRFEVNDVSSRCPEVVAALEEAWRDLVAAAESGRWDELPPLPEAATRDVD